MMNEKNPLPDVIKTINKESETTIEIPKKSKILSTKPVTKGSRAKSRKNTEEWLQKSREAELRELKKKQKQMLKMEKSLVKKADKISEKNSDWKFDEENKKKKKKHKKKKKSKHKKKHNEEDQIDRILNTTKKEIKSNLVGMKVTHNVENLEEGESVVLTLTDVPLLNKAGELVQEEKDELESQFLKEKKTFARNRKLRQETKAYDAFKEQSTGKKSSILSQYDDPEKETFVINEEMIENKKLGRKKNIKRLERNLLKKKNMGLSSKLSKARSLRHKGKLLSKLESRKRTILENKTSQGRSLFKQRRIGKNFQKNKKKGFSVQDLLVFSKDQQNNESSGNGNGNGNENENEKEKDQNHGSRVNVNQQKDALNFRNEKTKSNKLNSRKNGFNIALQRAQEKSNIYFQERDWEKQDNLKKIQSVKNISQMNTSKINNVLNRINEIRNKKKNNDTKIKIEKSENDEGDDEDEDEDEDQDEDGEFFVMNDTTEFINAHEMILNKDESDDDDDDDDDEDENNNDDDKSENENEFNNNQIKSEKEKGKNIPEIKIEKANQHLGKENKMEIIKEEEEEGEAGEEGEVKEKTETLKKNQDPNQDIWTKIKKKTDPLIGKGLGGVLRLLRNRGELKQNIQKMEEITQDNEEIQQIISKSVNRYSENDDDLSRGNRWRTRDRDRDRDRERKGSRKIQEEEEIRNRINKEIKLNPFKIEYFDSDGEKLDEKGAYKEMARAFHNKPGGWKKQEKIKRQKEQKKRITFSNRHDTPLGSTQIMKNFQKQTNQPYLVIQESRKNIDQDLLKKQLSQTKKNTKKRNRKKKKKNKEK
ncbi:u4/u6.u5 tri-snrnp-associated protein [Anaeramoeba flamelloides]|uniref:U4/u6.u5 tri-snrnp-associated protein n=1 Tax=Anaeramoeba flamelloides TaxID=1746091 RepID=A0ABQ8YMM9_9EUKA|nr:u4/u6.u5 tri-snrnp-associated protein [Anaeramoeba flamelloides]